MFRIKICGVTNIADAVAAAAAGADAIGLNFYTGSSRFVTQDQAAEIVAAAPPGVRKVGVFVNSKADEVRQVAGRHSLDLVQLHGDEPPEFMTRLGDLGVVRAFRLGAFFPAAGCAGGLHAVSSYLAECRRLVTMPRMVLLDADRAGAYGGTGQTLDWSLVSEYHQLDSPPPLILAGGLVAENVAQAIAEARPAAVDTASGVEASPGRKDHAKIEAFVAAAKAAFEENDARGRVGVRR